MRLDWIRLALEKQAGKFYIPQNMEEAGAFHFFFIFSTSFLDVALHGI